MKSFLVALGAIALTSSAATAADFTRYGIDIKNDEYCHYAPASMPASVVEAKINACAEQEVDERKLFSPISRMYSYRNQNYIPESQWGQLKELVMRLVSLGRTGVVLKVVNAEKAAENQATQQRTYGAGYRIY
jgi:hypothetical protein